MAKALLEDILEEELSRAFEVKDREALKRYVRVVVESFSEKSDVKELGYETKEGFKLISKDLLIISDRLMELKKDISEVREETKKEISEVREEMKKEISEIREDIRLLIEMMNKRFEEQREYTDKRFEELLHYSDKRFEDINKRFEDINKRFEDVNKRFEDMNRSLNLLTWMVGIGFTVITVLIAVFRFIQ
jgi:vacuolar-type H+-ATPase subunit H